MKPTTKMFRGNLGTLKTNTRVAKNFVAFIILALVSLVVTRPACVAEPLKYGLINPPTHLSVDMANYFDKLVGKRTNGKVRIRAYPGSQLVRSDDWFQSVQMGTVDFSSGSIALLEGFVPQITILDGAYMFKNLDHARRMLASPIIGNWNKSLVKKAGVRILGMWLFGVRHLTANKAVYSPEDLKGEVIRGVSTPVMLAAVEGLGATVTPMDWGELYTAMQTGVVLGQENPVDIIYNASFFEVQKYLMLTGHITMLQPILMNEKRFQSYSKDIQKVLLQSAKEATAYQTENYIKNEKEFLEKLKQKGMTVIGVPEGLKLETFRKRAHSYVLNKFLPVWGKELYENIQSLAVKK